MRSAEIPRKEKRAGITPITARGVEPIVITRPMTSGSPPNRRCQ
jgi:hypothetical protein